MNNESKYGIKKDIKTIIYFLKLVHKANKLYIPILFTSSVFKAMVPFINVIMPKYIIDELIGQKRIEILFGLVAFTVVGNFIINLINRWFLTIVEIKNEEIVHSFNIMVGEKVMDLDFEKVEDPDILDLKEEVVETLRINNLILWTTRNVVNLCSQLITVIGLISIIAILDMFLIVFIAAMAIIYTRFLKKGESTRYEFFKEIVPINRKHLYYIGINTDFSMGKDVRLYNMMPILMERIKGFQKILYKHFGDLHKFNFKYNGLSKINLEFQNLIIYGYIIFKVLKKGLSIGDFTLYTNAALKFSTVLSDLTRTYTHLSQNCRYLELFIKLQSLEEYKNEGAESIQGLEEYNIEFKNVSFKYPRAKSYTLKNINITIKNGEKLSVVGLNGAGKTTFIKLLARLYVPTEGEILLNGVNIEKYKYDEYMKLLAVVFQDYKLLSFSIKENISLSDYEVAVDSEVEESIAKSGFGKDLEKLDNGIYTSIYKNFDKQGIEFSGGQSQKLAIARAIYKQAPIVILDEPTSALDPFAEFEIYSKFNELIGGKTTIYISHRLSSCKFCDKIAVFHNGEIIQYGSHDELVNEEGKEYYNMYSAQAQYYI